MKTIDYKQVRIDNKLTQTQMSELIGVSLRTIQSYEKGKTQPSADSIMKYMELNKQNISYSSEAIPVDYKEMNVMMVKAILFHSNSLHLSKKWSFYLKHSSQNSVMTLLFIHLAVFSVLQKF